MCATDRVIHECGVGTFGRVLTCEDMRTLQRVAIKVVRNVERYTDSARLEADIIHRVNTLDTRNRSLCVRLLDRFDDQGHFCMVFEELGESLYMYLKKVHYQALPLRLVKVFSYQLLTAVAFLHEMRLVHTDLKLENVLLHPTEFVASRERNRDTPNVHVLVPVRTDVKRTCTRGRRYAVAQMCVCGCSYRFWWRDI